MIVAYDLRFASDHFAGIGTHGAALLEALIEQPGDEHYLVIHDSSLRHTRHDLAALARHPRVTWTESRLAPLGVGGWLGLGGWLRARRPDVYLSPFYLLPPAAGCPSVLTIHDVHPLRLPSEMGLKGRLFYRLSLAIAARAAAIVTSSEFSRREIVELMGVSPERVHLTRLGVPPRRHVGEPRPPSCPPAGRFALVVGDNRPRKNLEVLAHAWARFGDRPPLALVWAGRPLSRHEGLIELADRIGARGVIGTGWIDEGELSWLYAHAELVVFPSRYEGFGFPLVEGFAQGTPVIASDIPPLREIGEGVARFVPPEDAAGWAAAVAELADDAVERERMRAAGRARAAAMTYERTAAATLVVLRAVARNAIRSGAVR